MAIEPRISRNGIARHLGVNPSLVSRWLSPKKPHAGLESLIRLRVAVDEIRAAQ